MKRHLFLAAALAACSSSSSPGAETADVMALDSAGTDASATDDATGDAQADDAQADDAQADDTAETPVETGTYPLWDPAADLTSTEHFYDQPWPGDQRLTADGKPDMRGFPFVTDSLTGADLVAMASTHRGFPVISAGYFRFSGPIGAHDAATVYPADMSSPILLINIDHDSVARGQLIPVVAQTLAKDGWTPDNLLGVAPRPGFVLEPHTTYAYVVRRSLKDAAGAPLGVSRELDELRQRTPSAHPDFDDPTYSALDLLYAPLFDVLTDPTDVAGATVFTTSDVVADLAATADALVKQYPVTIKDLHVDPDDGATHARFCELVGTVTLPQFQVGTPPYATEGLFDESAGLPKKQRDEDAPITITLPKDLGFMPEGGYPLVIYFHGSGNLSSEVVDRGKVETPDGPARKGEGPSYVLAPHGFATAGFALPLNPQRLPGASDTAYLNITNPKALRDTFRQGAIEARMVIEALSKLEIDPAIVSQCTGLMRTRAQFVFKVDVDPLFAMGNSMGGMYANIVSAIEPRVTALAPSGAGGFWTYFILDNPYQPVKDIIGPAFWGTDAPMTLLHPAVHLAQDVLSAADPLLYVPRLGHNPLAGHPVRSVFEPVGKDDKYFPTTLFDAIALGYGNQQAGDVEWDTMQTALTLGGHGGLATFPVFDNQTSLDGRKYTGVVVQYTGVKEADPHSIISQLDSVKYQYGCFLATKRDTGTAVLPGPAPYGTPCPTDK